MIAGREHREHREHREQTLRLPPRWFVRAAWVLHRAIYSLTGGRFGLWRPEAGGRFGTLRLTTLARDLDDPSYATSWHTPVEAAVT